MVDGDGIWRNGLWHDLPDIKVTVMRVMGSGKPPCKYEPGDTFTITAFKAPEGLCVWAITAMQFYLGAVRARGRLDWEPDQEAAEFCCCDSDNPVVFELRVVERKDAVEQH